MTTNTQAYFSFNSTLEFEKKTYHLIITLYYNKGLGRKEYEVASAEFTGSNKLLVYTKIKNSINREWIDSHTEDKSEFVQMIGDVIYRHNV